MLAGCGSGGGPGAVLAAKKTPDAAETFLKWSMDQHKAMHSYHAQLTMNYDGLGGGSSAGAGPSEMTPRITIDYQAPNKFRIETGTMGMIQASISDGTKLVTTTGLASIPPTTGVAPASLASFGGGPLGMAYGGLPMFTMFGGSAAYDALVDTSKGEPTFGATKLYDNEMCREVTFTTGGMLGKCTVLIGEKTGLDYRWACDLAPMKGMFGGSSTGSKTLDQQKTDAMMLSFEAAGAKVNPSIDTAKFDTTKLPKTTTPDFPGLTSKGAGAGAAPQEDTPMKAGDTAPDFTVTDLSGKSVALSSLKGRPVMLDFWATWCGPCRESLPDTDKFSQKYKNVTVLAISDEDKSTVEKFVQDNHYSFRACLDTGRDANTKYHVSAIPTFVFIDAQGKIAKYIVGGGQADDEVAALKSIGAHG